VIEPVLLRYCFGQEQAKLLFPDTGQQSSRTPQGCKALNRESDVPGPLRFFDADWMRDFHATCVRIYHPGLIPHQSAGCGPAGERKYAVLRGCVAVIAFLSVSRPPIDGRFPGNFGTKTHSMLRLVLSLLNSFCMK
jgi:hypothetical protein